MSIQVQQRKHGDWSNLWKKEDWWSVWLGLGIVLLGIVLWSSGSLIVKNLSVSFPSWTAFSKVSTFLGQNWSYLLALYFAFLVFFGIAVKFLGHSLRQFTAGFTVLYALSILVSIFGSWSTAKTYNLEAPLVALALGLIIGNILPIPKWLDTALRTEFYVKTGIVLLGATLPFTLILQAGPVAFAQATVVAVSTFLTIYWVGTRWFGLDKRFAATLGAGGSICGVSASIAVGGAVKAEKQEVSIAISLVIIWAILMIFFLPAVIKLWGIGAGPAGAWIGTSEFADAAGVAAASSIGEQAIKTFTLNKVVGRDMFIGIWCFILAIISITKWDNQEKGSKAEVKEIWVRFPKFVLGFFIASILISVITLSLDPAAAKTFSTNLVSPVKELRTWMFSFTFLSIGLTTRFRELTSVGWKPIAAFSTGVVVNVILGFALSVVFLGGFWAGIK
ncbi:YeiH family protein [Desulfitobacterium sp. AusDCA]|uniref:YeiH family protein n=1 Tax=Desulfitobacterium sp. AusDCA TaxID=3240383 RepID=UPI003DA76B18